MTLLRVVVVLTALGLTILLGMQGYVDWWSFISMLARIAIRLILAAAAAFLGWGKHRARVLAH